MLHQFTRKSRRDQALFELWDRLDAGFFEHISRERLKDIQSAMQGRIVLPGMPDYNEDRMLFNPVFDTYPVMIVYCEVESDVELALTIGRELPVPFTVRSGGHCSAGFSSGYGVLIDVSGLSDATVDAENLIATVGPGCTWGTLDAMLDTHGLHVPGGECDDVCVGGFVQGGGYGFTSVTFGMNCDNVIDMRVMLADGSIVTASETVNSDLWWAMRGGTGGNFGILLSVRYRLRPLSDVFGWALIWPLQTGSDFENATDALMTLQSGYMLANLSPQMNIQVSLAYQPGTQGGLPPTTPLQPFLLVRGLFVGTEVDGMTQIQPLIDLPGAVLQWTQVESFVKLNTDLLNQPYSMPWFPPNSPMPYENKASRYVTRQLQPSEWRSLLDYFVTSPNTFSYFYMEFYGGAINAYPVDGSAFVHRTAAFNAVLDVLWFDPDDESTCVSFLNGWQDLMAPMWNGEIYQNYPRVDQPDYGPCYWAGAQAGLYAVKVKYDPEHAFTFAQEVCPPIPPTFGPGPVIPLSPWLQDALDQPIEYSRSPVSRSRIPERTSLRLATQSANTDAASAAERHPTGVH